MNRDYFKWIVILALASLGIVLVFLGDKKFSHHSAIPTQIVPRSSSPYQSYISALGIVEAGGGNILIGSPLNRIVEKVAVTVGQQVKKGDILFQLESLDLEADLASRIIEYQNAEASLKKLEAMPRAEDAASAKAQLDNAKAELEQAKSLYQRVEGLNKNGALSGEEIMRRRFVFEEAEGKFLQAQANFNKIAAGAWSPDLEIARLQVKQAKAQVLRVKADIERTIIRSPIDGTVLQIKIHKGEYPPAGSSRTPSMILGDLNTMNLRVSINQFDASYYTPSAPAEAFLQGNSKISFPIRFLRIEPYLVKKQNLSNELPETADTQVLQVIYSFEKGEKRVFVGQQMDVFIETHFTQTE